MTKIEQLQEALRPYIGEYPRKEDAVEEGNVEHFIELVEYFGYEDIMLQHIKDHPEEKFWDFFHVLPFRKGEIIFLGEDSEPTGDEDDIFEFSEEPPPGAEEEHRWYWFTPREKP